MLSLSFFVRVEERSSVAETVVETSLDTASRQARSLLETNGDGLAGEWSHA